MSREAARRLALALSLARRGDLGASASQAAAALASAPVGPVALPAALLLFVGRRYHESLAALALTPGPGARWLTYQLATQLGWDQEARAALAQGAALQPREPRWPTALLALLTRRRDLAGALAQGEALRAAGTPPPGALLELALVHRARGDADAARRLLSGALALTPSPPARLEVARLCLSLGDLAEARALLLALVDDPDLGLDARALLASLSLWEGDLDGASASARSLLGGPAPADPPLQAASLRILGVVALLRGDPAQATAHLHEAARVDPGEAEALVWLAELALRRGQLPLTHELASQAVIRARGLLLPAHLVQLRALLQERGDALQHLGTADLLLPAVGAFCPDLLPALRSGDVDAWRLALDRGLDLMHGNRSLTPTWRSPAGLAPVPAGVEPRYESRRALDQIRVCTPAQAIADLSALQALFPRSGLPLAHLGELHLWLGDTPAARAALERAIDVATRTRWAYIGLTMCDLLDGDPEQALRTSARGVAAMSNTEGPAVLVHRGEALRLLGRLPDAEVDLSRSVALHPKRVGAWVNLGLLRLAQGSSAGALVCMENVYKHAPGLATDAARLAGATLFPTPAMSDRDLPAVLARARELLQGNRASSCVSYLLPGGHLRFGAPGSSLASLHGDDPARLAQVEGLLRPLARGA